MNNESKHKSALTEHLRQLRGYVTLRHEDVRVSGIPDVSITGYARTSWWEIKHGMPAFKSKGVQEVMCNHLASAGFCRYIIFWEYKDTQRTLIVHPKQMQGAHAWKAKDFRDLPAMAEAHNIGFSMHFIVNYIRQTHEPR